MVQTRNYKNALQKREEEKKRLKQKRDEERKRLKTTRNRIDDLPADIISNIFLGFCVKTLLGFKCVSKNWRQLFEDPTFIKQHFQHFQKHKKNTFIIQAYRWYSERDDEDFHTQFYSIGNDESSKLESPRGRDNLLNFISCDGLICFLSCLNWIRVRNPATKESILLPKSNVVGETVSYNWGRTIVLGLGFDSCLKKYKVVCWDIYGQKVQVLTIGTKSWRNVECPYPSPSKEIRIGCDDGLGFPVYVNGTSHWYCGSKIVTFNYCDEKFGGISLPEGHQVDSCKLFEVGGCLFLVIKETTDMVVKMWILKNYDKREWISKRVSLPFKYITSAFIMLVQDGEILIETKVGRHLYHRCLCAYNEEGHVTSSKRVEEIKGGPISTVSLTRRALRAYDVIELNMEEAPKKERKNPKRAYNVIELNMDRGNLIIFRQRGA